MMDLKNIFKKKKIEAEEPVKAGEVKAENKQRDFVDGLVSTKDIIAPSAIEVDFNHIRIDNKYYRTLFVPVYPRWVNINWLSSLINFDASLSISMYIYPTDGKEVLDDLRRKIAEMEAELTTDLQRGKIVNASTQAKLEDALNLQQDLVKGEERFFQFGLYITISAETPEELDRINKNIESTLGSLMIISKKATLQMEEGFTTTLPICDDRLKVTRNMDTTSLATTFPFVSSDLSDDKGIMYGINQHNGSLVVFDRFSMPNYNSVVFATSGVGKSYLVKLEAMRSLMFGTEILVIDPENEYREMCEAVGGQYIAFGYDEASKINPFDLSLLLDNEEDRKNALNNKVLSLHKLFKVMLGEMDPLEESILDKAIVAAYRAKGITPDPETQRKEPPLIEDLYKSLIGMEEEKARLLAARLEKFIKGSFAGIFNQKTTVELKNRFVVFGIRNLEDALRPLAMHIILDYIWTIVKRNMKKRILVVDEAWYLMQYDDSAAFLRGIVKRGRKYYLGVTTITQDVDDFLETPYGKEIVTNSSIQILLKQHSAAIDKIGQIFYLSEGEKQLLLSADKGEGIFFAGQNHVAIRVIASESEHKLITSDPEELMKMKGKKMGLEKTDEDDLPINPVVSVNLEEEPEAITNFQNPIAPINDQIPISNIETQISDKKVEKSETVEETDINKKDDEGMTGAVILDERGKQESNNSQFSNSNLQTNEGEIPEIKTVAEETENPTDILQKRIAKMEASEKTKIEEHEKKVDEEEKKKIEVANSKTLYDGKGSGGLPKYQDLFKSPVKPVVNTDVVKTVPPVVKPIVKNDGVNPFAPKEVPEPDLSKIKPLQKDSIKTDEVKKVEEKIDRKDVKVEIEGKAEDERDEKVVKDKKGMSYDDLFGN